MSQWGCPRIFIVAGLSRVRQPDSGESGHNRRNLWIAPMLATLAMIPAMHAQTPVFQEVAQSIGLNFVHVSGADGQFYLPEIMGSGVALLDYDNDGDLDVYLVQGHGLGTSGSAESESPRNKLYRNELIPGGTLRFVDVSREAGVDDDGYGMGVAVGDSDNDGDLDLYVTNFGSNLMYRNEGNGTFKDVTRESGTDDPRWSTSAAFVDYDRDGDLDLYVSNYIDFTVAGNKRCYDPVGNPDYCNPNQYRPLPDRLFQNQGNGRFVDVTEASGIGAAVGPGLGMTCADFDGDDWVDIYVANDGAANFLWMNQRNGTFTEEGLLRGAAYNADGAPEASMGVAAGDFDNDGDEDVFLTHLTQEKNTLYVNDGHGNFLDETAMYGLAIPSLPFTSFGVDWFDYDSDGFLDLFAANGAVRRLEAVRGEEYPYDQKNQLFRNMGGNRFGETSASAGPAFELSETSRGAAFGDIDNDGDVDIVMTNNNGPVRVFLNQVGLRNHWLQINLKGSRSDGSRVILLKDDGRVLWRRSKRDGSYLSANDDRVHFGLGTATGIRAVLVEWASGKREMWENIRADSSVTLTAGTGRPWTAQMESRLRATPGRITATAE
ncbi:MAG: CRTAC1 family protein [Acidobacteria bacterium]|nr:MAG: CRTAC1 family protein [Acidobacteriota bacterium]